MSRITASAADVPKDGSALADEAFSLDIGALVPIRAIERRIAVLGSQKALVGQMKRLVIPHLVEEFAAAVRGNHLRDHERIAAEGLGSALLGVDAQTIDGRANQNDAAHANDDAKQRQEATELVGAD